MGYEFKNLPGLKPDETDAPRGSFGRRDAPGPRRNRSFSAGRLAALCVFIALGAYLVAQLADVI